MITEECYAELREQMRKLLKEEEKKIKIATKLLHRKKTTKSKSIK